MNYLAQLGGQENAPVVWSYTRDADGNVTGQALKENFFAPIAEDVVGSFYTCAPGSFVEDYIGYEEGKGNFEFIKDAACVKLNVGGVEYVTAQIEARDGADFSLEFTNPDSETASFWLDYYYGNGTTTEKFIWTFGENVTIFNKADLTYKLQLTEKAEVPGDYDVITNISATLYPTDSEGEEGEPEVFPIPEVNYTVLPISVSGHKIWNDNDNADNMRPDSITIRLFADGVEVDSKTVTEADGWEWTFEGLQQTNEGKEIVYTITEDAVEGYESVVDGFDVTNTYVPEEDEEIIEEEEKPELPETEEEETEEEIEEEKPEVPETEEEVEEPEIPETEEEVEEPEIPETEEEEPEEPEVEIEEPEIPLAPGTEPPQTGDSSSMIMWIAAAVVSTSLFVISSKKLVCASEEE